MNLKKTFVVCFCFCVFPLISVSGQSVRITSKQVTYTRPKPKSDFKKTFTINYPKISGTSRALIEKIERSISYAKVLSFSLDAEMCEYEWLEEAEFSVDYNKRGILSVYLSMSGTTAHQTSFGKNVNVDLGTGRQFKATDVFTNLDGLISKVKKIQNEEIAEFKESIKKDNEYNSLDFDNQFQYTDFNKLNLEDFSISDDGVTFHYRHSFPYIIRHLEPPGYYFLNWTSMKPFIKRGGLLRKFIR